MRPDFSVRQRNRDPEPHIFRLAHFQPHQFALQLRANHTGRGFKGYFVFRAGHAVRVTRKTSGAVSAHFRFAAIGVVVAHPKIRAVRRALQHEHSICAHPAVPIANLRDLIRGQLQIAKAIIDHHEIVPRAIHFHETQHGQFVTTN